MFASKRAFCFAFISSIYTDSTTDLQSIFASVKILGALTYKKAL